MSPRGARPRRGATVPTMTDATQFHRMDATAQAELVRSGQASPLELVDHAIGRIEALNPRLNAVIHERFELAQIGRAHV